MLLKKVQEFIAKGNLLKQGDKVIVGVSGGADSTALLKILNDIGYQCFAVHCNFHLRGSESDRDEQFVAGLCKDMGIGLEICSYDTASYAREHHVSIEMAARELRYADFERIREQTGASAICIAHHRDDSVETLLLNLMRGTGIRGLCGIRPRNGFIVRPLLCASRGEIEEYLKESGQQYVTDSTNLETDYTRNKIRLQLLPIMRQINPNVDEAIDRTSDHLSQALDMYLEQVEHERNRVCHKCENGYDIDISHISPNFRTVLFEILSPFGFSEKQIGQILETAVNGDPGSRYTAGKWVPFRDRDSLLLRDESSVTNDFFLEMTPVEGLEVKLPDGSSMIFSFAPADAPISRASNVATLDAGLVGNRLTIRAVRQGDSFHPFGMKGRRLLSDFMTDLKFNPIQKSSQLVLTGQDDILWVIGRRTDNRYRVSEQTERQLVITLIQH